MEMVASQMNPREEMVEIVVKVAPGAAVPGARHDELFAAMSHLGVDFETGSARGVAAAPDGYFTAIVPRSVAERVVGTIQHFDGIEAAYVKSRGEPPSGENP